MRLTFHNSYLSITSFETVDLPRFSIVTGPNGVGKTHLLRAIQSGQISTGLEGSVLFADNSSSLGRAEQYQGGKYASEQMQLAQAFQQLEKNSVLRSTASQIYDRALNIIMNADDSVADLRRRAEIAIRNTLEKDQPDLWRRFNDVQNSLSNYVEEVLKQFPSARYRMHKAAKRLNIPFSEVSSTNAAQEEDFGTVDFLGQSFSQLFYVYHHRLMSNKFNQFLNQDDSDTVYLTDNEFLELYGEPPWELMNKALSSFNSDLEFVKPKGYPLSVCVAYLRKKSTGAYIDYDSLSSGERVFFSLFAATYKHIDGRQRTRIPKVLLLDEVEATLHPSMIRSFLQSIQQMFVEEMNIDVIPTTHSPTTVALADEASIYVMDAEPRRLRKVTKDRAIAELTTDVPFLSLSFDGRRQVMVEAPSDAQIYSRLYTILRAKLPSGRSLQFIPVGNGAEGSGCAQVKSIVGQLIAAGNASVFALLDWDGEHAPSTRMKVLGHGRRDGLENVILDPLLIACLIMRDVRQYLTELGLTPEASLPAFVESGFADAQRLASLVEDLVLGAAPDAERVECVYNGGLTLNLRRDYLEHDDHELEAKIRERFGGLKEVKARAGYLGLRMADAVLNDCPKLIPSEIVQAFTDLLQA